MGYDATYVGRSAPAFQRNLPSAGSRVLLHYAGGIGTCLKTAIFRHHCNDRQYAMGPKLVADTGGSLRLMLPEKCWFVSTMTYIRLKIRYPLYVFSLYVAIYTDAALILHFLLPVTRAERNEAPAYCIFYDFLENCHIFWLKCTYEIILLNTGTNFKVSCMFIFFLG